MYMYLFCSSNKYTDSGFCATGSMQLMWTFRKVSSDFVFGATIFSTVQTDHLFSVTDTSKFFCSTCYKMYIHQSRTQIWNDVLSMVTWTPGCGCSHNVEYKLLLLFLWKHNQLISCLWEKEAERDSTAKKWSPWQKNREAAQWKQLHIRWEAIICT